MKVSLVHETKSAPKAEKDKGVLPFGLKPPGKRAEQNGGAEKSAKQNGATKKGKGAEEKCEDSSNSGEDSSSSGEDSSSSSGEDSSRSGKDSSSSSSSPDSLD